MSSQTSQTSTEEIGKRLELVYRAWRQAGGTRLSAEIRNIFARIGVNPSDPLFQSGVQIARNVDSWGGYEYHSALHHAEVATNLFALSEYSETALSRELLACGIVAAAGHDWGITPTPFHERIAFKMENESANRVVAVCASFGVSAENQKIIRSLILATEPSARPFLCGRADAPDELPIELTQDERLLEVARMLADADMLSSAGLTSNATLERNQWLADEEGRSPSVQNLNGFLCGVMGTGFASKAGQHFNPNLEAIRASISQELTPSSLLP